MFRQSQLQPQLQPKLQPLLHDLAITVRAPSCALSGVDGQIRPAGVQGLFTADVRVIDRAVLRVDDREPTPIAWSPGGPGVASFVAVARWLGDPGPDPTVRVTRTRRVAAAGMTEEISIASTASVPVQATVTVELGCDLAPIDEVKAGLIPVALPAVQAGGDGWRWSTGGTVVVAGGTAATADEGDDRHVSIRWSIALGPRESVTLRWWVRVEDAHAVVRAPAGEAPLEWSRPTVVADDRRIVRLLDRALDDLESLRLRLTDESGGGPAGGPADTFIAAGVPWYLTLFGRDSLWTARMMLPLGTGLAAGTLRALAARQGTVGSADTGEAPGKILHELRRHDVFTSSAAPNQPFAYYGSVDATPLWISLLHDAWRWGMPPHEVAALLPALEAALRWLDTASRDTDGFLKYVDTSGHGLSNQGWKDSGDSVRFRDGRQAAPPIALAEVQGYAHEAAVGGAALLDAFDRPGGDYWRAWAHTLAQRFRAAFWVDAPSGPYPALGLDRDRRPIDALTSNIGHLLGTGILSAAESAVVADLLASPTLAGGFGLRTMSDSDAAFSPLSYHCGSIWAHDTAIVVERLAGTGHATVAAVLADGLLTAAEAFDYRLPELYGGDARAAVARPVPYPAACRPQAWSAAAAVMLLHAALGVHPDVPAGTLTVTPLVGAPLGAITVHGLSIAGAPLTVSIDGTGSPTLGPLPSNLSLK
jgi:glycogen debranching enzyme